MEFIIVICSLVIPIKRKTFSKISIVFLVEWNKKITFKKLNINIILFQIPQYMIAFIDRATYFSSLSIDKKTQCIYATYV